MLYLIINYIPTLYQSIFVVSTNIYQGLAFVPKWCPHFQCRLTITTLPFYMLINNLRNYGGAIFIPRPFLFLVATDQGFFVFDGGIPPNHYYERSVRNRNVLNQIYNILVCNNLSNRLAAFLVPPLL